MNSIRSSPGLLSARHINQDCLMDDGIDGVMFGFEGFGAVAESGGGECWVEGCPF